METDVVTEFTDTVGNTITPETLVDCFPCSCQTAEQLALQEIANKHMPLIPSLNILSKKECTSLIRDCMGSSSKVEQATFLAIITDYVTCASQNRDFFKLFQNKSDLGGIPSLLECLNMNWIIFFRSLNLKDLTSEQWKSALCLLSQSVNRLAHHKGCMESSLSIGNFYFRKIQTEMYEVEEPTLQRTGYVEAIQPSDVTIPYLISVGNFETNPHNTPADKALKERTGKSVSNQVMGTPNSSKKKRYTSDITKYILKSCENKVATKTPVPDSKTIVPSKENHLEVPGKTTVELLGLNRGKVHPPPVKRPCLEETNPPVLRNAFEILMRCKQASKGKGKI